MLTKDGNVVMADPFSSKRNNKYDLEQKQKPWQIVFEIYKLEAEAEPKKHWDLKSEKHIAPSLSFNSKAVREFFPSLKKVWWSRIQESVAVGHQVLSEN